MKKILFILLCLFITGCGHNVYTSSKGIGLQMSWNPDSFVPSFRGGEYNVTAFVPRGNSNMSMTTSTRWCFRNWWNKSNNDCFIWNTI